MTLILYFDSGLLHFLNLQMRNHICCVWKSVTLKRCRWSGFLQCSHGVCPEMSSEIIETYNFRWRCFKRLSSRSIKFSFQFSTKKIYKRLFPEQVVIVLVAFLQFIEFNFGHQTCHYSKNYFFIKKELSIKALGFIHRHEV